MKQKILLVFIMILTLAGVTSCSSNDDEKEKTDPVIEKIDNIINGFINEYSKEYLKVENNVYTIDYHILTGIHLLEKSGYDVKVTDYLTNDEVQIYVNGLAYETVSEIFVASLLDKIYEVDTSIAKNTLAKLENVDQWNLTYAYSALNHYNVNDDLKNDILSKITVIKEEDYRDADYAGMALCVLSEDTVDKSSLIGLISPNVTNDGISTWGTANACSTSYSILGLLANGANLNKEFVDEENETLVENLLKFEENNKFKWELEGIVDDQFATPQAFLALVSYKLFLNNCETLEIF